MGKTKKTKKPTKNRLFSKKELAWIIVIIIISSFISFIPILPTDSPTIITILAIFTIIIFTNILTKKIIANHYSIKIEHTILEFRRWGYYKRSYLKKPFPLGLVFPFFLALFSLGYIKPLTFLQFNAENVETRRLLRAAGQRRAQKKEPEFINEEDLAYTSASGFYALLALALIGLIINSLGFPEGTLLTTFSIYYGAWNLLPLGNLDGTKLFYGAYLGWILMVIIFLTSLGLMIIF